MGSKKYMEVLHNPYKVSKLKKHDIMIIELVSCMCDNMSKIKISKKENGEALISHYNDRCSLAFSNLQAKCDTDDIAWAWMDGDYQEVIKLLDTSTSKVVSVKVR